MDSIGAGSGLKYVRLREWLIDSIENRVYKYGDKLPSENMLCKKFGISRQTVRNAIAQLEQEGAVKRVRGSGTYVERMVEAKPRGNNIGVLLSYLDDYIFPPIIRGIEEVLSREGFGIDLGITHNRVDNEAKFLERMLEVSVAGVIVEGTRTAIPNPNIPLYKRLMEMGIPFIFVHNYYPELSCPSVLMDDAGCVRLMTQMLIDAGHRNIAGIFKSDDIQGHWRYKGYVEALMHAGIPVCEDHIFWYNTEDFNRGLITRNDQLFLQDLGDATAVVCYNDQVATDISELLHRCGLRIPDDVSIVSVDDSYLARSGSVKFTSAAHPKNIMGIEVANRLVRIIKGEAEPQEYSRYIIAPQIVERPSIKTVSPQDGNAACAEPRRIPICQNTP